MDFCLYKYPSCNKFTLAPCIGCNDDLHDIRASQLLLHRLILPHGLVYDNKIQLIRHNRQVLNTPGFILFTIGLRISKRHKMTKCPCHDIFITLQIAISTLRTSKHAGKISPHRRFFCQYTNFTQYGTPFPIFNTSVTKHFYPFLLYVV